MFFLLILHRFRFSNRFVRYPLPYILISLEASWQVILYSNRTQTDIITTYIRNQTYSKQNRNKIESPNHTPFHAPLIYHVTHTSLSNCLWMQAVSRPIIPLALSCLILDMSDHSFNTDSPSARAIMCKYRMRLAS